MYDKTLHELNEELRITKGKTLAALADGKIAEYESLKKEEESLQEKIKAREEIAKQENATKNKNKIDAKDSIRNERLEFSRNELAQLNCADKKITVYQGTDIKRLEFTYNELLQKMNVILKAEKSFDVGDEYRGKLIATIVDKQTNFVFHFDNYDKKDFVLEVSNIESIETFMKSLTLISCTVDHEYEEAVSHTLTESDFRYTGESIIRNLFQSFANALYGKE